jgi:hypothetical protein
MLNDEHNNKEPIMKIIRWFKQWLTAPISRLKRQETAVRLRVVQLVIDAFFGRGKLHVYYDDNGTMLVSSNADK